MPYFEKESDAWRHIAEVFAMTSAPRHEWNAFLDANGYDRVRFSCIRNGAGMLAIAGMIHTSDALFQAMIERAVSYIFTENGKQSMEPHDDEARSLAALWLGEEARHEGN